MNDLDKRIADASASYSYWLDYKTPQDAPCDTNIKTAWDHLTSLMRERDELRLTGE